MGKMNHVSRIVEKVLKKLKTWLKAPNYEGLNIEGSKTSASIKELIGHKKIYQKSFTCSLTKDEEKTILIGAKA